MNTLSLQMNIRHGGVDTNLNFDIPDGILDFHKVKLGADNLKQKILKVREQIKIEQASRDGYVAEYLKQELRQAAGWAHQTSLEKKNQQSARSIAQLQKKLEQYHRKRREMEQNGASRSSKDISKDNLKDIQHSLKDAHVKSRTAPHGMESGKSGMPGGPLTPLVFVFNKSREFANLIRNKFGSADDIAHLKNSLEEFRPEASVRVYVGSSTVVNKPKNGSDDECSSGTSGSADSSGNQSFGAGEAGTLDRQGKFTMFLEELQEIRDTQVQLVEDIKALKVQLKKQYGFISQEERKGRGKKEEEKLKEEEEILAVPKLTGESSDKEWFPPSDPDFCVYVYEVTKSILPITNIKEQIEALAKYVAEKMGGKISKEKLPDFGWELHISELKFQLKSNVIPIGYIKKGIFYHRALLFKALADKIGLGCSLVRGEYGRAWNEVKLQNESRKGATGGLPQPEVYIVDLMFHPGSLLRLQSREADLYRFL